MIQFNEQYIIDENGDKKAIVIPVSEWNKIQEELEELEDIRAYDEVKAKISNQIRFEDAIKEVYKK